MDTLADSEARIVSIPSRDQGFFVRLESSSAPSPWCISASGFSGIAKSAKLTLPKPPAGTSPSFRAEEAVTCTFAGVALGKIRRPEYTEHLELLPSPAVTLRSLFPWSLTHRNRTEDTASSPHASKNVRRTVQKGCDDGSRVRHGYRFRTYRLERIGAMDVR